MIDRRQSPYIHQEDVRFEYCEKCKKMTPHEQKTHRCVICGEKRQEER